MKTFWTQFFTWWNSQTLGTRFHTWRYGKRVGEDQSGNVYYEGGTNSDGRTRRWVIYNGYAEGSAVPPGWHGWLHHRVDDAPIGRELQAARLAEAASSRISPAALPPTGRRARCLSGKHRPQVTGDYDAWTPGS